MEPFKVLLSHVKAAGIEDFAAAVADHVSDMEAHRFTIGAPAPTAHPLVERAVMRVQYPVAAVHRPHREYEIEHEGKTVQVREPDGKPVHFTSSAKPDDFAPNYVLIDDTPPPLTLEQRKDRLEHECKCQAALAFDRASPRRKRGYMELKVSDAHSVPEEDRTSEHKAALAHHAEVNKKIAAVNEHLARLLNDIEDLTEDSINTWEPAPFPA